MTYKTRWAELDERTSKQEFFAKLRELYSAMNMADSDNPDRARWMNPDMAGPHGCGAIDAILQSASFTPEERQHFYDSLY